MHVTDVGRRVVFERPAIEFLCEAGVVIYLGELGHCQCNRGIGKAKMFSDLLEGGRSSWLTVDLAIRLARVGRWM